MNRNGKGSIDKRMFESFKRAAQRDHSGRGLRVVVRNLGGGDHYSIKVTRSASPEQRTAAPAANR